MLSSEVSCHSLSVHVHFCVKVFRQGKLNSRGMVNYGATGHERTIRILGGSICLNFKPDLDQIMKLSLTLDQNVPACFFSFANTIGIVAISQFLSWLWQTPHS